MAVIDWSLRILIKHVSSNRFPFYNYLYQLYSFVSEIMNECGQCTDKRTVSIMVLYVRSICGLHVNYKL